MFGAKPQHEFQIWHVPNRSPVVVYSMAVMRRIAEEAVEAYQNTPGSREVCGVLYGTLEGGEVRISASRSLPRERGEKEDEPEWNGSLERNRLDPELSGMHPVGWYVSHSQSAIALGEEELRVWDRFFPEPEQVMLVVRPHQGRPTRGGFFFRPREGRPEVNSSLLEFEAGPSPQGSHELRFLDGGNEEPLPVELMETAGGQRGWGKYAAAAAGVILAVAGAGYYLMQPEGSQGPETAVAMHLMESGGRLRAAWDVSSARVLEASSATLEVRDGPARLELPVSAALLRNGSWPIIRTTGEVRVRLRLKPYGEAAARFVGPVKVLTQETVDASGAEVESKRAEIAQIQSNLVALAESNNRLEAREAELQVQWRARIAAASQPPTAAVGVKPGASTAAGGPGQLTAPPGQGLFPERAELRPPVAAPPAVETPKPMAYAGPVSGKMIWTGLLPAGGTLNIDGRRPSMGNVNGALPGVRVRVSVYPAEFSSGGLVVYSGNAKHARGNVVEARSAQNGWLQTRYLYDAGRAGEVTVSEGPGTGNQVQHLQIRSTGKAVPVLVIEWEVAQ